MDDDLKVEYINLEPDAGMRIEIKKKVQPMAVIDESKCNFIIDGRNAGSIISLFKYGRRSSLIDIDGDGYILFEDTSDNKSYLSKLKDY